MTTVLFSITTKEVHIASLLNELEKSLYYEKLSIIIACEKSNILVQEFEKIKPKNIKLFTYPKGTNEESMIENTLSNLEKTKFVLIRNNCDYFTLEKLDDLIQQSLMGSEIVMFKSNKKQNFLKRFFTKIMQKLCDVFFCFKFYDGDIGMQLFSEQAHSLMKYTDVTILTKINRWVALNIFYIPANFKQTVIKGTDLEHNSVKAIIYSSIFIFAFVGTIVLSFFVKIHFLVWLLLICGFVALIAMSLYATLNVYAIKHLGNLKSKKTEYIKILSKESL